MPTGDSAWKGLALPLYGEAQIHQITAANDILTLTAITGSTGDFLVLETAGGGEVVAFGAAGAMTINGTMTISGTANLVARDRFFNFGSGAIATAPTTGMVKGNIFIQWISDDAAGFGMCMSTATQAVKWCRAFDSSTVGGSLDV